MNEMIIEASVLPPPTVRAGAIDVEEVPFVEMARQRLQGVVSSGSDIERVYCAFVEAGTLAYYSSTNNNRPDAGMEKRIGWLVESAITRYGAEAVFRFLQVPFELAANSKKPHVELMMEIRRRGGVRKEQAADIFARFLHYLRFVELQCAPGEYPEMAWFAE